MITLPGRGCPEDARGCGGRRGHGDYRDRHSPRRGAQAPTRDAVQVLPPSCVNQMERRGGAAGGATPWAAVVIPTWAKPPAGRAPRAAVQVAPPSVDTWMPTLV